MDGAMDSADTAVEARASEDLVSAGGQDWSAGRGCGGKRPASEATYLGDDQVLGGDAC